MARCQDPVPAPSSQDPARNELDRETSPYLRLHKDNPVHWQPWGEAAFARAKRENKPVFLSVGYAACHWCHVMAKESFEDAKVAAFLNEHFVCIKVDREERPDVDDLYMTAVLAMGLDGGWPLSVWLTP
ncbi:MAG: thioredoxin domain-containing protein, partial [Planctomycetes bacterium]|nr:thioredoxin domain-containing protein [Planctomycetota bacterium]